MMLTSLRLWVVYRFIASVHGCEIGLQCGNLGGKLIDNVCYVHNDVPKSWDNAMEFCISHAPPGLFGHLAWLYNENIFLNHFSSDLENGAWIGLRHRLGLGTRFDLFWYNATNSPVIPIGFGPEGLDNGAIDYNTADDCFYRLSNKLIVKNCKNMKTSFCQYECQSATKSSLVTRSMAGEGCQSYCAWIGGFYSSGSCFFLEKKGVKGWENAMYSCSLAGSNDITHGVGRLSWIPNKQIWNMMWNNISNLKSDDKSAWIGLRKKEPSKLHSVLRWFSTACAIGSYVVNSVSQIHLSSLTDELCMAASSRKSGIAWYDRNCGDLNSFMCELDCTATVAPDTEDHCKSVIGENCGSCTDKGTCAEKHLAISNYQQMIEVCNVRSKSNQRVGALPVVNSVEDHDAIQELAESQSLTVIPLALYAQDNLFYWPASSGESIWHSYDGLDMPVPDEGLCYKLILPKQIVGEACTVKQQTGFLCQTSCAAPTTTTSTTTTTTTLTTTTVITTTTAAAKVAKAKKNLLSATEKMVVAALQSIGCTFIISSLSVTIVLFILLRDFSVERCIQMSYEIATLCGHILVLTVRDITDKTTECVLAGIGFHYFFLASFVFLLLESLQTYAILTNVISFGGFMSRKMNLLVGWLLAPIPIVAIGVVIGYSDYNSENSCWLNFGHSAVVATVVGPIFLIGWSTVILTEAAGQKSYNKLPDSDKHQRLAATVNHKGILFVTFTSIAAWFVGAFAVYHVKVHLYSVVTLLNMILGIVVFLFHALGNQEAHKLIMKLVNKVRMNTPVTNNKQSKEKGDTRGTPETELPQVTKIPGKGWINDFFK